MLLSFYPILYILTVVLLFCLQQMLEDKLRETEREATTEALEEAVARESYLQWLRDNEKRARNKVTTLCMFMNE